LVVSLAGWNTCRCAALAKQKEAQAAIEADLKASREAWKAQKAALVRPQEEKRSRAGAGPRRAREGAASTPPAA